MAAKKKKFTMGIEKYLFYEELYWYVHLGPSMSGQS